MIPDAETSTLERLDRDTARLAFRVPLDYPPCAGHFPGAPLVPGVTQIGWALRLIEEILDSPLPPYRISRFKFRVAITPGDLVEATAKRSGQRFDIVVQSNGQTAASGAISLVS